MKNNFVKALIVSSTLASVFSVLLVAIDRFIYILHGLKYHQFIFPNRVRVLIITTWLLGKYNIKKFWGGLLRN